MNLNPNPDRNPESNPKANPISVAIDGPSGAGKSTIARAAAAQLGYLYVDTGAMYRAIGLAAYRQGIAPDDTAGICALLPACSLTLRYQEGKQHILLNGQDVSADIRTPVISTYASCVSAIPTVRQFLLQLQRDMAKTQSVLMDGRDIGTVILPHAQVKIFLTASLARRSERRWRELVEKGQNVTLEQVQADMAWRDTQDSQRAAAPLKQAPDAILLDTSDLTLEQSIEAVLRLIRASTSPTEG